jgi:hypothetical protein
MTKMIKATFDSMSRRDKRALLFGIAAVVAIVVYLYIALPLFNDWTRIRDELNIYQSRLHDVRGQSAGSQAKIVGLYQTVPFMELPADEDAQRKLFWDKTYDQVKQAGIKLTSGPSYIASARRSKTAGPGSLRLKLSGTCNYTQLVKLLAGLNGNPYLVGIEELTVKTDEKKPGKVNIDMTIETFVKQEAR